MLRAQANQRGALSSGAGRMRRLSPVDEERDDTVSHPHRRVCELPRQLNSVRPPSAPGLHFPEGHAFADGLTSQPLKVTAIDEPRDKPGFFESVEPERARLFRRRLFRVGGQDFQVGRGPERDQGVSCSAPRVLAPGGRPDA